MSLAAVFLVLMPQASGADPAADAGAPAFVEVVAPVGGFHVGELVPLQVRFGFETSFWDRGLLQLFRQPLDLPVQLSLAWDGLRRHPVEEDPAGLLRFAVGTGVGLARPAAEQEREGRAFTVFVHQRVVVAERPGELLVPGPVLRFASATGFVDDPLQGRVPAGRVEGRVTGAPLRLPVGALPAAGRPPGFSGAVGRFTIRASADPRPLETGDPLELHLRIEGDGLLDAVEAPDLSGLEGFHVLGRIQEPAAGALSFRYQLAPLPGAAGALPPIAFSYFDPADDAYATVWSEAIPLPGSGAVGPPPELSGRVEDPGVAPEPDPVSKLLMVALFLGPVALVGLIFLGWQRRHRLAVASLPSPPVARTAVPAPLGASGEGPVEASAAEQDDFELQLAAWLSCSPASLVRQDLAQQLRLAGLAEDLADRAAALHRARIAARYGAPAQPELASELAALTAALRRRRP